VTAWVHIQAEHVGFVVAVVPSRPNWTPPSTIPIKKKAAPISHVLAPSLSLRYIADIKIEQGKIKGIKKFQAFGNA
jgi:hypothetical protein